MSIKINKPYKVIPAKVKRYQAHYQMPADHSLIVPLKVLGDEVSCDIRWEDGNGELKLLQNKMFLQENLAPLNPLIDHQLQELWEHYYNVQENQA